MLKQVNPLTIEPHPQPLKIRRVPITVRLARIQVNEDVVILSSISLETGGSNPTTDVDVRGNEFKNKYS